MGRKVLLIILAITFSSMVFLPCIAFCQGNQYVYITAPMAPVYLVPSDKAEPFDALNQGESFPFISESEVMGKTWYQIMMKDGSKAWIRSENGRKTTLKNGVLAPGSAPVAGQPTVSHSPGQYLMKVVVVVESESAKVYSNTSVNSETIGEVRKGYQFDLKQRLGQWRQIEIAGHLGWVNADHLSERVVQVQQSAAPPPPPPQKTVASKPAPKSKQGSGFFAELDLGSTLFEIYGTFEYWLTIEETDDTTNDEEDFNAKQGPIYTFFMGYHAKDWALGPEMAILVGQFEFPNEATVDYSTFHLGPRYRRYIGSGKTRAFFEAVFGYTYSRIDPGPDSYTVHLYNLGGSFGVMYQSPGPLGFGMSARSEYFGPIKKGEVYDRGGVQLKAAYGWIPVGIHMMGIYRF